MCPDFHSISTKPAVPHVLAVLPSDFLATAITPEAEQSESAGRECEALQTEPC